MVEDTPKPEEEEEEEVVVVEKELLPPPPEEAPLEEEKEKLTVEQDEEEEVVVVKPEDKITESVSFKEETNVVAELPEPHKKALEELKLLVQEALNKHEFTSLPPKDEVKLSEKVAEEAVEVEVNPPPPVTAEETKEEVEESPASVVVEEVVVLETKAAEVDDDGAKTVEAIKETIVEFAPPPPAEAEVPAELPQEATELVNEPPAQEIEAPPPQPEEVFLWGIPLLGDERSDVILLKFLRARDFKVKDALTMIKKTVLWRKEFGIESLLEEDLGNEFDKVVFTHGVDKEGHPVCYNVYGEFRNILADEEKQKKFLKWRIQFLERSIRKLDFSPTGVCSILQVNDLKNSPGIIQKELRQATRQTLELLQDNYPEFLAKQVFVNVPWWFFALFRLISPFLTQRTKSKFVVSRSPDALFKYIAPELVPVQYGGLSRDGELEFTIAEPTTEVTVKPLSKQAVEFPITESSVVVWEVRVVGWEVSYGAEFVPTSGESYTLIIQKARKITWEDEMVITNSFKVEEAGKVILLIDNQSYKKKKLLYRFKIKTYPN